MGNIERAKEIYRRYGAIPLLLKTLQHSLRTAEDAYWDIFNANQIFVIEGYEAEFLGGSHSGGDKIRSDFESGNDMLQEFVGEIRPNDVVYDVGAHVGLFSCFAASAVTSGSVVAFEPHPQNFEALKSNLSLNNRTSKVVNVALSNESRTTDLAAKDGINVSNSILGDGYEDLTEKIDIQTERAETVIETQKLPKPTVVKIDVEGAEGPVIEGFGNYLSSIRTIFVEIHLPSNTDRPSITDSGWTREELEKSLVENGFSLEVINERNHAVHLKATSDQR